MKSRRNGGILASLVIGFAISCAMLLAVGTAPAPATSSVRKHPVPVELGGGASSPEALVDLFLEALNDNDEAALHRLRVSRGEYRAIFVPGTVEKGETPRQVSEKPAEFFTNMIDTKSQDFARVLLSRFGGHRYTRTALTFSEGIHEYAWYTAMGETRVQVRDAAGGTGTIMTGYIAEVNGVYKFIGFEWDE